MAKQEVLEDHGHSCCVFILYLLSDVADFSGSGSALWAKAGLGTDGAQGSVTLSHSRLIKIDKAFIRSVQGHILSPL